MEFIRGSEDTFKIFGTWKHKQRPDLDRPFKLAGNVTTVIDLTRQVAKSMAEMHAYFWMNKDFIEANKSWVGRTDWFEGRNLKKYTESVNMLKGFWTTWCKSHCVKGTVNYDFHPRV